MIRAAESTAAHLCFLHPHIPTMPTCVMIDLENMPHAVKEALAEDCEDYLLHRHIPLMSHSYDNIIMQALREGYQMTKFDRPIR